ncbi:MAG: hypothetical protein IJR63_00075 [Synergistaceae bacterium]|nr:hypothetical protein [Synergistaceae bacterium]
MKRIICAVMLVCVMVSYAWADVEISAENFPDDVFRNILLQIDSADFDRDGWLNDGEIAKFKALPLAGYGIKSLKGIEYFTELEGLDCSDNELTVLDLSRNTSLTYIVCASNDLTALDFSHNTALTELYCYRNSLAELDLRMCKSLIEVNCENITSLRELNVSGLTSLVSLDCNGCPLMTSLDVSGCSSLVSLFCQNHLIFPGRIRKLDLSASRNLQNLNCGFNALTELDLSGKTELVFVNCQQNAISELDVKDSRKLERLSCGSNQIAELDVSSCTELVYLNCNWNWLKALNVSNCTKLEALHCADNSIQELDLSHNSRLTAIECSDNQIAALDFTGLPLSGDLDYVGNQRVGHLVAEYQPDEDALYPYYMDFSRYLASIQIGRVIASSVKGFGEDGAEIGTVYSDGIARFADKPSIVRYGYSTGLGSVSSDVSIIEDDYTALSLSNHVYRIFPYGMSWGNAEAYCESLGGHLITISGGEERELAAELCRRAREVLGFGWSVFWTGGEKTGFLKTEDRWKWVTGEPFTETVSEDLTELVRYLEYGTVPSQSVMIGETNFNNLALNRNGELITGSSQWVYGFICEWEPVSADFIPLLQKDTTPRGNNFSGYLQDPRDLSNLVSDPPRVSTPATLPAKFDPREEGRKLPEVRNQGNYGTCWSFASIGALEASYMRRFGGTADLSELHQAWYVFRDPREGYSQPLNDSSDHVLSQGGWASLSIHFLSGIGPASEESLKYDQATISDIERLTAGRYPENYPHPVRLSDAYELGVINASNRSQMAKIIKSLVYENGAVEAGYSLDDNDSGYNLAKTSYYLPSSVEAPYGHAVQIVGWDDNYNSSEFKNTPSINGAWLIKNSYGENWGDEGYFWLSYEQSLHNVSAYIAAKDTGARMYGHDNLSAKHAYYYRWGASVFRATGNETLSAVSFYTRANNVPYKIYINVHGKEEPTTEDFSVTAAPSAEGTQDYAGYHTVNLASPVSLKAGEYFTVILNLGGNAPLMVMENDNDSGRDMTSVITSAGKCYFSNSTGTPIAKEWKDGKSILGGSFNGSIRAFTGGGTGTGAVVSITTSSLPDGVVGQEYTATLEASSTSKVQWLVSGLPNGLRCEENIISGIPETEGIYRVSVTAGNDDGTDFRTLSLTVNPDTPNDPDTPNTPDTPDTPSEPGTPDTPTTQSSGGGGGGCDTSSLAAMFGALALAFTVSRKQ